MKKSILAIIFLLASAFHSQASIPTGPQQKPPKQQTLIDLFAQKDDSSPFLSLIKKRTFELGGQAVPSLVKVMKSDEFTDKKRWLATFSLGKIMGKKSFPFIAKFTRHPNWMLRLASLKTLLALQDRSSKKFYRDALKDTSLIVRLQALENIRVLKIKECGKNVWEMIFHKHNYTGKKGKRKRTVIVGKAIRAMGDLQYTQAKKPLMKMAKSKKYQDLSGDIQYALAKIK